MRLQNEAEQFAEKESTLDAKLAASEQAAYGQETYDVDTGDTGVVLLDPSTVEPAAKRLRTVQQGAVQALNVQKTVFMKIKQEVASDFARSQEEQKEQAEEIEDARSPPVHTVHSRPQPDFYRDEWQTRICFSTFQQSKFDAIVKLALESGANLADVNRIKNQQWSTSN